MTRAETCRAFARWVCGEPLFTVEAAEEARRWLARAKAPSDALLLADFEATKRELGAWFNNENPELPESLCVRVNYWLHHTEDAGG